MSATIHPITMRLVDALAQGDEGGLDTQELRVCANLILATPDTQTVGVELIALARQMAAIGCAAICDQLVVLAGLALGDSAGASVRALEERQEEGPAIPTFRSNKAPEGSVPGGPLARLSAEAVVAQESTAESACPWHRFVAKVAPKKRKPAI